MKTAPKRVGTQYTSSDMVFGIFFLHQKADFQKADFQKADFQKASEKSLFASKQAGKTRKTQESLRFSDGIYFDP